ncbi:protein ABHD18-like [Daphnia pulex]|uniref:protein ABHD18-like n=1 Tax=Daphnia pulex TaxID=6669 RepID=UPI001EDF3A37|nr:protein ABHD18-like [Daphnia pulex]
MGASKLDRVYRNLVLSKFFVRGWGNPENIKRLFDFRKIVSDREKCQSLVDPMHKVTFTKEEDHKHYKILNGHFQSPFAHHLPGLVPEESETAHFQMLLPKKWNWSNGLKPMVVQLAGTGDHFFWRRRILMGKPLLNEWNVGSIILENPFYGLRKPKEQKLSCLHNVSDIFVMGGCLILESLVLFHWCERNGLGPLGVTGVSMGGHMASLAASSWPKPVVLVPCLSWSTASAVFTRGVMSGAIDWSLLESQYFSNQIYNEILDMVLQSPSVGDCAFDAGKQFAQNYSRSIGSKIAVPSNAQPLPSNDQQRLTSAVEETFNFKLSGLSGMAIPESWKRIGNVSLASPLRRIIQPFWKERVQGMEKAQARQQAMEFMRGIMDEFTHIANYSRPVDSSCIVIVTANDDAYVPREGCTDLRQLWPGAEVRYVSSGHVAAYVLHHQMFRRAVKDAFDKIIAKHYATPPAI